MNVVFWSGCVDMHTANVFNYLGQDNDVIIAYVDRSFRGYTEVIVPNCQLVNIETLADVFQLIEETSDYIHISNAFKVIPKHWILHRALKELVKKRCYLISLFQEQYPYNGLLGFMRRVKWMYTYNWGMGRTHKLIGYCGTKAYFSLRKAFVSKARLVEFIYTPWYNNSFTTTVTKISTFIMVGQLVPRKCIIETINIFKQINKDFVFKIIGDGFLKNEVINLIQNDSRFKYLGTLKPEEVQKEYSNSDVLILSSSFDGWGCSVNEAISQGCRVIVSDNCGSESLIRTNPMLGNVFHSGNWTELKQFIVSSIVEGPLDLKKKHSIKEWSQNISPQVEAEYLQEVLNSLYNSKPLPQAPWCQSNL